MIIVTTEKIHGYEIEKVLGLHLVWSCEVWRKYCSRFRFNPTKGERRYK